MAYVKQVCEGYNKNTLIGNWYEERLYPPQPFREDIQKQPRGKDQTITTLDGSGFQRALPRLERRTKWETSGRVILDDKIPFQYSEAKGKYPHGQVQKTEQVMNKPFDKNLDNVKNTDHHPNSQMRTKQKSYHFMNERNPHEQGVNRQVTLRNSDFRSTLPVHPQTIKQPRFGTTYGKSFGVQRQSSLQKTQSNFQRSRKQAGHFNPTKYQQVQPITTMVAQMKKQTGDLKQQTGVQRSWVPQRDKCLSYSVGKTAQNFHNINVTKNDIQTNLNINKGIHNLHPKIPEDGYFRHVRTVTVQQNKSLCPRP